MDLPANMATVRIPSPMRDLVGNQKRIESSCPSVRAMIDEIDAAHPGFKSRLLDGDGELSAFVQIYVGDEDIRFLSGLETEISAGTRVSIVPAAAGG